MGVILTVQVVVGVSAAVRSEVGLAVYLYINFYIWR